MRLHANGGANIDTVSCIHIPFSSYYPLLPAFAKEEPKTQPKAPHTPGAETTPTSHQCAPTGEQAAVNLDLLHMFEDEFACIPVRPDILILPSNLKPFAKVRHQCSSVSVQPPVVVVGLLL